MSYSILLEKYPNLKLTELNIGYTNKMVSLEGLNEHIIAKIFTKEQRQFKNEVQ